MKYFYKIDRSANPFSELNIFDQKNKSLLLCFSFFFIVAVCGYLSVINLSVPYRDDWYRYLWNSHVGGSEALRSGTALIEYLFYLSNVVTDASPFTQVLSCATLAYIACIFLKIFKINTKNKWEIICLTPIVINPYLLEVMLYRFDNFFIILSLLMVSLSVYLSNQNKKKYFITQSLLLFISLFVYQVAISVYLTTLTYEFMKKIHSGKTFPTAVCEIKYWLYSLIATSLGYISFLKRLDYGRAEDGSVLTIPYNLENITVIIHNLCSYFQTLHNDWSPSIAGLILFAMVFFFAIKNLAETAKTTKSVSSILLVLVLIFIFILCPSGPYIGLKVFKENNLIPPRLLCGIGVFMSIVLYEVYLLFQINKITKTLIKVISCLIVTWNLMFLNSAVNIMRENFRIRNLVEHDIAKDILEMSDTYPQITDFRIIGEVTIPANKNFFELYPIMDRIFLEKLDMLKHYRLGFVHHKLGKKLMSDEHIFSKAPEYVSKKLIKTQLMYDLYMLDNHILQIELKNDDNRKGKDRFVMKIPKKMKTPPKINSEIQ